MYYHVSVFIMEHWLERGSKDGGQKKEMGITRFKYLGL